MGEVQCKVRGRGMVEAGWKPRDGEIREDECKVACGWMREFGWKAGGGQMRKAGMKGALEREEMDGVKTGVDQRQRVVLSPLGFMVFLNVIGEHVLVAYVYIRAPKT